MTTQGNYSWIILMASGEVLQSNGNRLVVEPAGGLTVHGGKPEYVVLSLAPGTYQRATIMSQISGYQNGYDVLAPPNEELAAPKTRRGGKAVAARPHEQD